MKERFRLNGEGQWIHNDREVEVTEVIQALTEEQEKDLDEMARRFEKTLGGK